jgi:hypothetical protein
MRLPFRRNGCCQSWGGGVRPTILAGLAEVPCRTEDISHNDLFFKRRLTEYNRQRVKGIDEVFREELLRADALSQRLDIRILDRPELI